MANSTLATFDKPLLMEVKAAVEHHLLTTRGMFIGYVEAGDGRALRTGYILAQLVLNAKGEFVPGDRYFIKGSVSYSALVEYALTVPTYTPARIDPDIDEWIKPKGMGS